MIKVNEKNIPFKENTYLMDLKKKIKFDADLVIYNGFPSSENLLIKDGDEIVFIKKGELPEQSELENLILARHSPGIADKLRKACVGIAGLGGIGSNVAVSLVRSGVGSLVLADFDVVEPSNLNRQQYFINQIGQKKTLALKANLKLINPYVRTSFYDVFLDEYNLPEIYKDVDVLVEAFDLPDAKSMLVDCFLKKFPDRFVVAVSGIAGYFDANEIRTRRYANLFLVGDGVSSASYGNGLMAPRVCVAAGHQANKVIEIILGA